MSAASSASSPPGTTLRVLEVFQPPEGGVPTHVQLLSEGLARRGHDVRVVGPPSTPVRAPLERAGIPYEPLSVVGNMPAPRKDVSVLRGLISMIRRDGYDVVHAHGQKAGVLGRLASFRLGVPAVYTPHFFIYRTQLHRPRRSARARYRLGRGMERALGRRSAAIIVCSREELRQALVDLAPAENVVLVVNGVAMDGDVPPSPELQAFRGEGPLLGLVAALREQKGLPTLIDALERLAARGSAPRFAIVGNGPLEGEVRRRLAASPIAESTLLLPFAGRAEPYLGALDAFVHPSYWELIPLSVMEAMALGLPVVATAVGGVPEAVEEGVTGFLVPPYDAPALADAIERVASDHEARKRMGEAGRQVAADRFGVDRMVQETELVYRRVARPGSLRAPPARIGLDDSGEVTPREA